MGQFIFEENNLIFERTEEAPFLFLGDMLLCMGICLGDKRR